MARKLAAKCALATRIDALSEDTKDAQVGLESRAALETMLRNEQERGPKKISNFTQKHEKYHFKRYVIFQRKYNLYILVRRSSMISLWMHLNLQRRESLRMMKKSKMVAVVRRSKLKRKLKRLSLRKRKRRRARSLRTKIWSKLLFVNFLLSSFLLNCFTLFTVTKLSCCCWPFVSNKAQIISLGLHKEVPCLCNLLHFGFSTNSSDTLPIEANIAILEACTISTYFYFAHAFRIRAILWIIAKQIPKDKWMLFFSIQTNFDPQSRSSLLQVGRGAYSYISSV